METCKECNQQFSSRIALSYHLRDHNIKYVDYLVKHEYGGTWPTCSCGKKLVRKPAGFPRYCSKSCASSGTNNPMHGRIGENSPIYGIKRTEDQLKNYSEGARKRWHVHGDKLRKMMSTEEYKKANSEGQKQSYIKNPDLKRIRSEGVNKFWSSSPLAESLRKEASERAVKLLSQGLIGPQAPFKTEWKRNPWTGQDEYMHSSWESAFMDACIARGYPITKDHNITIPYTHPDGTQRTYVPDFYGFEDRVLYEVKGRHDEVDDAKWSAALEWCKSKGMRFECLFENDLSL